MQDLIKEYQKSREERIFNQIHEKYSQFIFRIAQKYLANQEQAKDVAQDTWIKILNNFDKYDSDKASFKTWIGSICIRTALDKLRKRKNIHNLNDSVIDIPEGESRTSPEFIFTQKEVINAIGKLPEDYRIILELYLIAEYKIKEIAVHLDMSFSYIKSKVRRGINSLQKELKQLDSEIMNADNVGKQTIHSVLLAKIQEIYGVETLFSLQNYLDIIGDKYLQSRRSTSLRLNSDYTERFTLISSQI